METGRPRFERKEAAISATPYVYLPLDIPAFTVEVCHREAVRGDMLQQALLRTLRRMPYLSDTFEVEKGRVYYATNPLPMEAAHTREIRRVGSRETNYHMLDLTWDGNTTWFTMYHGFCDGQGMNMFMESVLYHYYCIRDGKDYEAGGIRTDREKMTDAETIEPLAGTYAVSPDYVLPGKGEEQAPFHLPEITPTRSVEVFDFGIGVDTGEFMTFVRNLGTSPAVAFSMLTGEAILRRHPDHTAPVRAVIPMSVRRMLGCGETFKNCSHRSVLPLTGKETDRLPFAERAAALRGMLKAQMHPDRVRSLVNRLGERHRKRVEAAEDYREEIRRPAGILEMCHDTFYLDYIGSLRPTEYAGKITDVRFLCVPSGGNTLHLNVIEQDGTFRMDALSCQDIAPLAEELEEVMRSHGLKPRAVSPRRFTLTCTAWRDGMDFDGK